MGEEGVRVTGGGSLTGREQAGLGRRDVVERLPIGIRKRDRDHARNLNYIEVM